MTADRCALMAALRYSAKQKRRIDLLMSEARRLHHQVGELRRRLADVQACASGSANGEMPCCNEPQER